METVQTPGINPAQVLQEKNLIGTEKYSKWLNETPFPGDRLTAMWKYLAMTAINKASPLSLRISLKEFKNVVESDVHNLTFFQFGCLSNAIEVISIKDAEMSKEEYLEVIEEALSHIEFYQQETFKVNKQIGIEVEKEYSMKLAAMAAPKSNILKPVKAEA